MTTHTTAFFDGLAGQDFARLASALAGDAHLSALIPPGLREVEGAAEIQATFARWFGDTLGFELVETAVAELGPRLHLRWRARLRAARLGDGWFVVEQQAFADTAVDGRITRMSLLCSGYCPDGRA
ncbi:nuclear transport factor 2 family protein [Amycolatopsis sp. NPDC004625]|uniref:nuclear transport factor 2 family protein n=1 Tax=Amycolatopsis sp. NPDC004625 TaxID=3154670 RepID=UPI0033ACF380